LINERIADVQNIARNHRRAGYISQPDRYIIRRMGRFLGLFGGKMFGGLPKGRQ
jgi:hypothetical protein